MRASDLCAWLAVAAALGGMWWCVRTDEGWPIAAGFGAGSALMLFAIAFAASDTRRADAARSRREVEAATYRWERVRTLRAAEAPKED